MATFKNALVSVSDKSGLTDFLKPMVALGLRVVSTGGTLKHLRENGIDAVDISEQTGFPEVMDGRVKTLHPRVHMPILARQGNAEDLALLREEKLDPFDLVIVNLYPFAEAKRRGAKGEELIEYIDIGGPSLLRAAAKNHARVAVICEPNDYAWVKEKSELNLHDRRRLAARVYAHTSSYDDLIAKTLSQPEESPMTLVGTRVAELRYGENPQQQAAWFRRDDCEFGLHDARILHGKALSYNNILDLDAAVDTVRAFSSAAAVAVKHNNPCGVGTFTTLPGAVERAIQADPVSVFGGIIAVNRTVDLESAELLAKIFLECVIAPAFEPAALERLQKKKDLRLLQWPEFSGNRKENQFRTVAGGFVVQTADEVDQWSDAWTFIGKPPSIEIKNDLIFAWHVCAKLKSNAIVVAGGGRTLGMGMGQVNRVDAVAHAIERMRQHHSGRGIAVLASDAFFPFADSIERIAEAGIHWVIQPGGSIRDAEVIEKAKQLGVNMVLTGVRHFRH